MNKIFSIISFFCCLTMNSQNTKVENVTLEHYGGVYAGPNSLIQLSIISTDVNNKYMDVFAKIDKKEFRSQISLKKFDIICEKLIKLKPKDIIMNAPMYLDPTLTELSFSINSNTVKYSVSGLSKGDKKTSRKDFLEITKLILEIAEVKIPYVN